MCKRALCERYGTLQLAESEPRICDTASRTSSGFTSPKVMEPMGSRSKRRRTTPSERDVPGLTSPSRHAAHFAMYEQTVSPDSGTDSATSALKSSNAALASV